MINKQRLLDTFLNIVKIDSPSGEEKQIISYLFKIFSSIGVKSDIDSYGNLIVKLNGKGVPIFISAHVDTVEPGRAIDPIIGNGIIKTDGTTILGADNKSAVAAIIEVVRCLVEKNVNHRALEIAFTNSEEVANLGAVNLDYKKISAREGYIFDNPNPVGTIIKASPFYNRFDIIIKGKSSHSSKPSEGINVIPIFTQAMQKISLGKVSDNTLVNVGVINSGHVRNSIPGEMVIRGEVRSFLEKEVEEYSQHVIKVFALISKKHNASIKSLIVRENGGYLYKGTEAIIKKTQNIVKSYGLKPTLKKIWGCSDANIFQEHGVKVLNLGNGSINTHTVRESITTDNLENLSKLIYSIATSK